jgi:hypothetical protein
MRKSFTGLHDPRFQISDTNFEVKHSELEFCCLMNISSVGECLNCVKMEHIKVIAKV